MTFVHRRRKPAKVTAALAAARKVQSEVFKKAWELSKAAGRDRPIAKDIGDARVELGLSRKGKM